MLAFALKMLLPTIMMFMIVESANEPEQPPQEITHNSTNGTD